jgi:putative phosphoribosyl transferase
MYANRKDAGEVLATHLVAVDLDHPVVLALPRGGVPVALPVARALDAPLDLLLVRKIGVPGQPELAAGALVDGPPEHIVFNESVMRALRLSQADLDGIIAGERARNAERRAAWLGNRVRPDLTGRSVIVVDDGIATGATMKAALMAVREQAPKEIILAVPVAAEDTLDEMRELVDRVICPQVPRLFRAVGLHYRDFAQVRDAEVAEILAQG